MEKFVTHYVWKQPDQLNEPNMHPNSAAPGLGGQTGQVMRKRLANRLTEMTDRRRRLIKYNYKKEEKTHLFESQYPETIRRKDQVIQKFTSL